MEDYIVIKEFPDASVGTIVKWCDEEHCYKYVKESCGYKRETNVLTRNQVEFSSFFCRVSEYDEHYGFYYPVLSRKEVLDLLKESFPDRRIDGKFSLSASAQLKHFEEELRKLAKKNAANICKKED